MAAFRISRLVRQFSSSAVRGQLVQAPIQVFGIEGRYAHALYSAASKENKLEGVEKELQLFQNLLQKDLKFAEYIANPSLKRLEKKVVIEGIAKKQNYSSLTTNLFSSLTENGRINKVSGVIKAFEKIMCAHRGEVVCVVTSAKSHFIKFLAATRGLIYINADLMTLTSGSTQGNKYGVVKTPLDNASQKELKQALQGFLKKGEILQLTLKVDPSIIGGIIVTVGDKYVDMSMLSKIKSYTNLMKQAV